MKKMKRSVAVLILLTLFSFKYQNRSNEGISQSERIINNFLLLIEEDVKDDNINGSISLAIVKGDSTIDARSFGLVDPEKDIFANSTTVYRIGSITKSFTGFLLMILNQEKIVSLDDPVEKFLPEIKGLVDYDKYPPITLRQLASHTSGLDRESRNRDANVGKIEEWEEKTLMVISGTSFRAAPGERFEYSNIGYALLGLAISRAADQPYIQLIKEKILVPLEMKHTFFALPEVQGNHLAKGMAGGPTADIDFDLPLREHSGRGARIPNGGLYSTPTDMTKFMKACMGYTSILSAASVELLQSTQTPTNRLRSNYSFGFDLYSSQGINTIGHGGSTPGYSAHFEYEKTSGYGIVIMRNYNFGNTNLDLRSNALLRKLSELE